MLNINTNNNIISMYAYGSVVYGTSTPLSDKDYIIVLKNKNIEDFNQSNDENYNLFSLDEWIEMCKENKIETIESRFLPQHLIYKEEFKNNFPIIAKNIRSAFSSISSNSFVKAKKKLIIQQDYNPYIAKKSLWHSLRILMFGIQILKYGCINNYQEANFLYQDIVLNEINDWEYYYKNFKPLYNSLKSQFRLLDNNDK